MKNTNCKKCGLRQFSVFQDCSNELLDELFSNKQFRQYAKNEGLIKQNERSQGVFCIQDGTVKISSFGNRNKEFILWFARPGDIIGVDSFINEHDHLFAATAATTVSACHIPDKDFRKLMEKDPEMAKKIMKVMCNEISSIEERITSISQKSVREQFAEMLISLATGNRRSEDEISPIHYSIKDLANTIGTTNNYLYKIISEFNDKNVVAIRDKKIVIKDFDKLSLIAIGEESIS